jgi:hypothetical protein
MPSATTTCLQALRSNAMTAFAIAMFATTFVVLGEPDFISTAPAQPCLEQT